jgi:poly-gamma-glutamate capsule biosynthesis protein CapA/YwtB (metallophosphatase superfamily)
MVKYNEQVKSREAAFLMSKKEPLSLLMVIFCIISFFLSGCSFAPASNNKIAEEIELGHEIELTDEALEKDLSDINKEDKNDVSQVLLAAVGDIMVHSPQLSSAYDHHKGVYNFHECFTDIAPHLQKADFAVGNFETTLAGSEKGFSGYPRFNSPVELAAALKDSGFDLLFTANNHSMDSGADGVMKTIENLEAAGLSYAGTARSQEEKESGFVFFQNDIKIIFYAYTYGTNGIPLPSDRDYLVSLIDEERIKSDVYRAKNIEKADLVIVSMHWGNEYERLPAEGQRELAEWLIDSGVDVIIGTHPHVIQPAEIIRTENSKGLVLYSLGNFISNQRWRYTDAGIVVYLQITKDHVLNKVEVSIQGTTPTWVHKFLEDGRWKFKVLPVEENLLEETLLKEAINAGSTGENNKLFPEENNFLPEKNSLSPEKKLSSEDYKRLEEILWETEEIFWRYLQ